MYTPSFVNITDGGLKIPQKLVELTWNDPYPEINFLHLKNSPGEILKICWHGKQSQEKKKYIDSYTQQKLRVFEDNLDKGMRLSLHVAFLKVTS